MNIYPVSEIAMTIFPELVNPIDNPPRVMSVYPYFSERQVKIRLIEMVSGMFEVQMADMFTQAKLRRFLIDNRNKLFELVEELLQECHGGDEPDVVGEDFVDFDLDIEGWIVYQPTP